MGSQTTPFRVKLTASIISTKVFGAAVLSLGWHIWSSDQASYMKAYSQFLFLQVQCHPRLWTAIIQCHHHHQWLNHLLLYLLWLLLPLCLLQQGWIILSLYLGCQLTRKLIFVACHLLLFLHHKVSTHFVTTASWWSSNDLFACCCCLCFSWPQLLLWNTALP